MKMKTNYFTNAEIALWAGSVSIIIISFLIFKGGDYFKLITSLIGVTSLIFIAKGNPVGQLLAVIFSLLYGIISFSFSYYGEMATYLGMTMPMAAFSLVSWLKNPYQGNKAEVKVNKLKLPEYLFLAILTGIVTVIFYFILDYFHTANMIPSTISVTTSFLAVYLTFRRSPYYAVCYAANDIVLIVLWILASREDISYISIVACFAAFLANDIYGFKNWKRMEKRQQKSVLCLLLCITFCLSGCSPSTQNGQDKTAEVIENVSYGKEPYEVIHDNEPAFTEKEKKNTKAFEKYAPLDALGRCGVAFANICQETMPTEKRGEIGQVKPSGWHTVKYDIVDGKYLYNRCHLIGYQLAGENANEKNLITGTRYLNVEGMLPFEDQVADYVQDTGNHVLYRVTPQYEGDNLVAEGVQMEAYSVEDQGKGICFHIFAYNVQPGITIDYRTGESEQTGMGESGKSQKTDTEDVLGDKQDQSKRNQSASEDGQKQNRNSKGASKTEQENITEDNGKNSVSEIMENEKQEYILNINTKKFHDPSCSSVKDTLAKNRKEVTESRDALIQQGYEPCGRCKP